jgi:hypothetical protein
MRHSALMLALLVMCALSGSSVRTAELDVPPRPPADKFSMQKGPPNCSRWTDGCVNCSRDADGEAAVCSNIGVACQPKAIRCVSTQPAKQ